MTQNVNATEIRALVMGWARAAGPRTWMACLRITPPTS